MTSWGAGCLAAGVVVERLVQFDAVELALRVLAWLDTLM